MIRSVARKAYPALLAGLVAIATQVACSSQAKAPEKPAEPEAVSVAVVTAAPGDIESVIQVSGSLAPRTQVDVNSKLPGTLDRVAVRLGDRVAAGATIATLDRREIDAQVDAAVAAVSVAKAGLEAAEATLANVASETGRARNLFEQGALPRQRLDAAETAHRASAAQRDLARANVAQAEAALRRAQAVRRDTILTAPTSGVVLARNFDAGAFVSPGDRPVVVIGDLRVMKLEAGVSELEAGRLRPGMRAMVAVAAHPGRAFAGQVSAVASAVDARNRHFQVEIRIDNPDGTLLAGMYGTGRIVVDRAESAVVVPREAVADRAGRRSVLKVEGDRVSAVPVVEGLRSDTHVQITSGIAAGDVLVADARRDVGGNVRVRAVYQ